jgi:hypothetical protein
MSEPFLILHKVRGEAALDIAIRCDDMGTPSDPGPWWIIPTSGHRAYPYRKWYMDDLYDGSDIGMPRPYDILNGVDPPPDLPDHYAVSMARSHLATVAGDLLSLIGLKPKAAAEPVKRRIIP